MAGIILFSLATGALALAPDGGWWYIALLRLLVGAGVAGVAVIAVRWRSSSRPRVSARWWSAS